MKYLFFLLMLICGKPLLCQVIQKEFKKETELQQDKIFTYEEFLGYVKKYHPLIKQADLVLSTGEANLLKARGSFDPKIEVDYERKEFKKTEYFDQLNTTFKIPTWYGIEFKANFEKNTGEFLNPNLTVPDDGLYSLGVSFSLAQGLLINKRMATLRKARYFKNQTLAERNILINNLLFEASAAYFDWLEATNEQAIQASFLENASLRIKAVKKSIEVGDKAAIDSIEAGIIVQNRKLNLEAATLKKRKSALIVSNYLWIKGIPVELKENALPVRPDVKTVKSSLILQEKNALDIARVLENHPKIISLDAKIDGLTVERSLKRNKLLPKINVQYNFLTSDFYETNTFNLDNYKTFINISVPLFLRKERGDLELANLKLRDANLDRMATTIQLQNKIKAVQIEIASLRKQKKLIEDITKDYQILVTAEERKFFLGESSLFLINSREQKLIDTKLKENKLMAKTLMAVAKLYNALGV